MSLTANQEPKTLAAFSIEHLSGNLTGQTQAFDFGLKEVPIQRMERNNPSIGTSNEDASTLHIHHKDKLVSRDGQGKIHVSKHGNKEDYRFSPRTGYYVEINSHPIAEDTLLKDGDVLTLGSADGVKLKFHILNCENNTTADEDKTALQTDQPANIRVSIKKHTRSVMLIGLLSITGVLLFSYFLSKSLEDELTSASTELRQEIISATEPAFAKVDREKLKSAIYLIARKSPQETIPLGTAWAISANRLITNAHVALSYEKLKPKEGLIAIQSISGEIWPLLNAPKIHPGYLGLKEYVQINQFGVESSDDGFAQSKFIEGYDLASFSLNDNKPFPNSLNVADPSAISNAQIGNAIAYVGFPSENTIFKTQAHLKPNPIFQFGQLTSKSDYFGLPTPDDLKSYLWHHNLPAEGGASGSPIINESGDVIAVLSAGNVLRINAGTENEKRISNPIQINFAQRADLVNSINDSERFNQLEQKTWKASSNHFDSRYQVLDQNFERESEKLFEGKIEYLTNEDQFTKETEEVGIRAITKFELDTSNHPKVGIYINTLNRSRIVVTFSSGDEKISPLFIEQQADYTMAWFPRVEGENLKILVESESKNAKQIKLKAGYPQ